MLCGNTRFVMLMVPCCVKISTDDWSTKMSSVTSLPSTHSGAFIEGMEKVPLNIVEPDFAVRCAVSVPAEGLMSNEKVSSASLESVIVVALSKAMVRRN